MRIYNAKQIKEWDKATILKEGITSLELMERAAQRVSTVLSQDYPKTKAFSILCGPGNNGGDGFAIARQLSDLGYSCSIVTEEPLLSSNDAKTNFNRLPKDLSHQTIQDFLHSELSPHTVIIDALFGSGLNRPLRSTWMQLVQKVNQLENCVVSIDVPSGLFIDQPNAITDHIIRADFLYTFQQFKLSFLLPYQGEFCGQIKVIDIGLDPLFEKNINSPYSIIHKQEIENLTKPRDKFSHKGSFGHAAIAGGSLGKIGAISLSIKATLRAGVGLCTSLTPTCGTIIVQSNAIEAMNIASGEEHIISFDSLLSYATVALGPGLGTHPETEVAFLSFLKNYTNKLVLDADALNLLAQNTEYFSCLPKNTILTPHPKEFERLFGPSENDYERLERASEISEKHEIFIVLKGAHTAIICPDNQIYFNTTGNPGMATGGSGDVLTGIITGLLAQGYSYKDSCVLAVLWHGIAGDIAKNKNGEKSLIASDIIENLGAINKI